MTNAIIETILANRGFSSAKINAKDLDVEEVKAWHTLCDRVHTEAYKIASQCYNNATSFLTFNAELNNVDKSGLYDAMREVFAQIGEIRGAKLFPNESTATTLVTMASTRKNSYSADMRYERQKLSLERKFLKDYEESNGVPGETIANIKANIAKIEAKIDELKKVEYSEFKVYTKTGASVFYKSFEDYIADLINHRLCMTEEDIIAEKEARKARAKARKAANKSK